MLTGAKSRVHPLTLSSTYLSLHRVGLLEQASSEGVYARDGALALNLLLTCRFTAPSPRACARVHQIYLRFDGSESGSEAGFYSSAPIIGSPSIPCCSREALECGRLVH